MWKQIISLHTMGPEGRWKIQNTAKPVSRVGGWATDTTGRRSVAPLKGPKMIGEQYDVYDSKDVQRLTQTALNGLVNCCYKLILQATQTVVKRAHSCVHVDRRRTKRLERLKLQSKGRNATTLEASQKENKRKWNYCYLLALDGTRFLFSVSRPGTPWVSWNYF